MSRLPLALVFVSVVVMTSAQPVSTPTTVAPTLSTQPTPPRAISPATADLINASLPKVVPLKPVDRRPDAESPDLRETDNPHNGIVRLPKYVVRESKPLVFTERE